MKKIISVVNQKGGVGKSTTVSALAAALTERGHRTLVIDLDAQCNLSYAYKVGSTGATALDVLTGAATAAEAIQHTESGDIIPGDSGLAGADALITQTGKEYKLREALEPIAAEYEYIIIDTPPALGILTINALTAADAAVIPAQADIFSLQGIDALSETIRAVQKYTNPSLTIDGILLTRYSSRTTLSREIAELAADIAYKMGTRLYNTRIPENVSIKEAQANCQPITRYAPKSNGAKKYFELLDEICAF